MEFNALRLGFCNISGEKQIENQPHNNHDHSEFI